MSMSLRDFQLWLGFSCLQVLYFIWKKEKEGNKSRESQKRVFNRTLCLNESVRHRNLITETDIYFIKVLTSTLWLPLIDGTVTSTFFFTFNCFVSSTSFIFHPLTPFSFYSLNTANISIFDRLDPKLISRRTKLWIWIGRWDN